MNEGSCSEMKFGIVAAEDKTIDCHKKNSVSDESRWLGCYLNWFNIDETMENLFTRN